MKETSIIIASHFGQKYYGVVRKYITPDKMTLYMKFNRIDADMSEILK